MANNSRLVAVGKPKIGGAIFRAPLPAVVPVDETTELDAKFIPQGYVSAEGLARAIAKAYEQIQAWGGDEVHRPRTEHSVTMTFTLIESHNAEVAKTIWGEESVTVTPATAEHGTRISVAYTGQELPDSAWAFDLADGDKVRRIVVPISQIVTESFDQTFGDSELIAYPVTITLRKDEDGVYFYEYSDDGIKAAA